VHDGGQVRWQAFAVAVFHDPLAFRLDQTQLTASDFKITRRLIDM
jgi:hypothetical protein